MKKQLLLGSALLAAISAFPQQSRTKQQPTAMVDMAERLARKYAIINNSLERTPDQASIVKPIGPTYPVERASSSSAAINWLPLSGSMNIYGMLVSTSKPLNYNDELNVVSFVHRKSFTYVPSPVATPSGAATGVLVADIATDLLGANNISSWDSTCVWNSNSQWARYPQGGIYNPPGNTSLSNAYVVATGPITQANSALGWIGSYAASKKLDVFDNIASTTPNAQQFIANTAPFGAVGKVDFPRADFSATDDGVIRSLGIIANNVNGTGAAYGWRGARIMKGTFNSGVFTWSGDSIIPPVLISGTSGGPMVNGQPHMAWNESGTVGYVWFIGCRSGATNNNMGYQPIVYKSTDAGNSWSLIAGINFNNSSFNAPVLDHLNSVRNNTTLTIPQFNASEGADGVVDMNNRLHIVATLVATSKDHPDSLGYSYLFTNADGEKYSMPHTPGQRPYIYDFTETSSGWNVTVVDSMSSEAPGETSGTDGYGANPWDPAGGTSGTDKVSSDARIQASRTADGKYILYSWAESDTNFTSSSQKWNSIPNVKARAMDLTSGGISPTEINVTNPSGGANPLVASHAQMHYMSPKCKITGTTTTQFTVALPMTVSNNQNVPMTQLLPNTHWYTTAEMVFNRPFVGIAENAVASVKNSQLYPNPAKGNASLLINLKDDSNVELKVMNLVGDVIKTSSVQGQTGDNSINVDLTGLSSGIYMVNVKVGNASIAKKLIVE